MFDFFRKAKERRIERERQLRLRIEKLRKKERNAMIAMCVVVVFIIVLCFVLGQFEEKDGKKSNKNLSQSSESANNKILTETTQAAISNEVKLEIERILSTDNLDYDFCFIPYIDYTYHTEYILINFAHKMKTTLNKYNRRHSTKYRLEVESDRIYTKGDNLFSDGKYEYYLFIENNENFVKVNDFKGNETVYPCNSPHLTYAAAVLKSYLKKRDIAESIRVLLSEKY